MLRALFDGSSEELAIVHVESRKTFGSGRLVLTETRFLERFEFIIGNGGFPSLFVRSENFRGRLVVIAP